MKMWGGSLGSRTASLEAFNGLCIAWHILYWDKNGTQRLSDWKLMLWMAHCHGYIRIHRDYYFFLVV